MNRQPHFQKREMLVAEAIREVISELRMIDAADLIAFIRMERLATLSDLIDTASELYFMPGTLKLGHGGEAHVAWDAPPRIVLDMELRPRGVTVYFSLALSAEFAEVEVNFVSFAGAGGNPEDNTARLATALRDARIVRTAEMSVSRRRRGPRSPHPRPAVGPSPSRGG